MNVHIKTNITANTNAHVYTMKISNCMLTLTQTPNLCSICKWQASLVSLCMSYNLLCYGYKRTIKYSLVWITSGKQQYMATPAYNAIIAQLNTSAHHTQMRTKWLTKPLLSVLYESSAGHNVASGRSNLIPQQPGMIYDVEQWSSNQWEIIT
jgi:hypothetical protein